MQVLYIPLAFELRCSNVVGEVSTTPRMIRSMDTKEEEGDRVMLIAIGLLLASVRLACVLVFE